MSAHEPESYLEPYRRAIDTHGAGFKATLWGSREAQVLRFDVMIDLAGFEGSTIVDAGCGTGDFAARLHERGISFGRFVGLDALPEMIEAGRQRDLDRCAFVVADFLAQPESIAAHEPDFVCVSGALNTVEEPAARAFIAAAFEASAQGVVFNFLSDHPHARWAGRDLTPARRYDTLEWIRWSLGLTSRVAFTQAYLDGHDATILLLHDDMIG